MDVKKQKSGEERVKEQRTSETVCFTWGTASVVFKDIKISLAFFGSFLGNAKKNRNINLTRKDNA